jgi:hypothetical protein
MHDRKEGHVSGEMSRILKVAGVISLGVILQGCAGTIQSPVPVVAERSEMTALVGNWSGEYNSAQSGRSGSIVFKLKSASDTAYGDVVMIPRAALTASGTPGTVASPAPMAAHGQVLTIRFVRLEGSHLVGRLDPYTDPVCGCRLTTVFTGDFKGNDVIEGTFQTTGAELHHPLTSGKWKVSRTAP